MAQNIHPIANGPASKMQAGARVALAGMTVNLILAIAKVTSGVVGKSYVLIADGIESVLDIGGSLVIWSGLKFAARPPDATHPYGHGKAEPMAAAIVAVGVVLAALGLGAQSIREIWLPHHAPAAFTLVVLIVVVVVKEFLYRYVIRLGKDVESTAVQTDAWHHRADALTSIAAFIGISISLLGGEKWRSADAWAALFVCTVIAANGCRLLFPALREMLDAAPRGNVAAVTKRAAVSVAGVLEVEKCLVRKMGLSYYVDLHVGVDGGMSVREGHEIAHQVKDAIKKSDSRIADVLVHVEPVDR
jgi:cation diffusion facilitator family transporter